MRRCRGWRCSAVGCNMDRGMPLLCDLVKIGGWWMVDGGWREGHDRPQLFTYREPLLRAARHRHSLTVGFVVAGYSLHQRSFLSLSTVNHIHSAHSQCNHHAFAVPSRSALRIREKEINKLINRIGCLPNSIIVMCDTVTTAPGLPNVAKREREREHVL